jgi:hypothetical protein
MSMFGRGSSAPSGAVNSERMEMAIQECVVRFTLSDCSDLTASGWTWSPTFLTALSRKSFDQTLLRTLTLISGRATPSV